MVYKEAICFTVHQSDGSYSVARFRAVMQRKSKEFPLRSMPQDVRGDHKLYVLLLKFFGKFKHVTNRLKDLMPEKGVAIQFGAPVML